MVFLWRPSPRSRPHAGGDARCSVRLSPSPHGASRGGGPPTEPTGARRERAGLPPAPAGPSSRCLSSDGGAKASDSVRARPQLCGRDTGLELPLHPQVGTPGSSSNPGARSCRPQPRDPRPAVLSSRLSPSGQGSQRVSAEPGSRRPQATYSLPRRCPARKWLAPRDPGQPEWAQGRELGLSLGFAAAAASPVQAELVRVLWTFWWSRWGRPRGRPPPRSHRRLVPKPQGSSSFPCGSAALPTCPPHP